MKIFTINELRENRARAWEAAKTFLDTHRTENGTLSAEDNATYERMEQEITDLGREIDRMERRTQMDAELNRDVSTPLTNRPGTGNNVKTGRASNEYKNAMLTALRTNFRQVSNVLQEGVDASGGYLVPEEWDSCLIDALSEENVMRKLGTSITTSGDHRINVAGTKPAASWVGEGAALTWGDGTFSQAVLEAHKLHVAVKVTEELLEDNAFGLENYLLTQFASALANAEEEAFLTGNGSNKPTGIFDTTHGGTVGVTAASSSLITADEILDLVYKLKRPYRKNAAFVMNDSTLALIRKLKDGNGAYLWQPALIGGEPDRLLGYPVYTSAYAPAVAANAAAIGFGDYSYYYIADRGTRAFQELRELFAGNGMVGYVAKERVDGKLILPEAVQVLKMGSAANG